MDDRAVIALDVGGSSVKHALVAAAPAAMPAAMPAAGPSVLGQVAVTPIDSGASAGEVLACLAGMIAGRLADAPNARGVALAFPGPCDYAAGISLTRGLQKYEALFGLDLGAELRARLGRPGLAFRYRNDAEAAIVGEALYGAGKQHGRLLGVTLGTGFGSAFVVDGRVTEAGPGVPPNGWLYPLLFRGRQADDLFSTRGLLERFRRRGLDVSDVASAAAVAQLAGDDNLGAAVRDSFAAFGVELGEFLAPIAAGFRADGVLILGGIAGAWGLIGPALQAALPTRAVTGALGNAAGVLGAAELFYGVSGGG